METDPAKGIPLFEMLQTLREELSASLAASRGELLRFRVESVEATVQVQVTRSREASGGVKFLVLEAGARGSTERQDVHTVKLQLKPVATDGREVLAGDRPMGSPGQ